jgi:hypothetical protein
MGSRDLSQNCVNARGQPRVACDTREIRLVILDVADFLRHEGSQVDMGRRWRADAWVHRT